MGEKVVTVLDVRLPRSWKLWVFGWLSRLRLVCAPRLILIGDVHGCFEELMDLLSNTSELQYRAGIDVLVFVGDVVNKGPHSLAVLRYLRKQQRRYPGTVYLVLGNHELKLVAISSYDKSCSYEKCCSSDNKEKRRRKKHMVQELYRMLSPEEVDWLVNQPRMLSFAGSEFGDLATAIIVVHAGVNPSHSLLRQNEWEVTHMRNVVQTGSSLSASEKIIEGSAWSEVWNGPELIVYGHDHKRGLDVKEFSVGLDTGCVYGKMLSALVLPGRQIVQVRARRAYRPPKHIDDEMKLID